MADVVVVSFHEKGFWQADYYRDASEWDRFDWSSGHVPDGFFTMKSDPSVNLDDCKRKAAETWPGADIREAAEDDEDEDWDE